MDRGHLLGNIALGHAVRQFRSPPREASSRHADLQGLALRGVATSFSAGERRGVRIRELKRTGFANTHFQLTTDLKTL